MYLANVLKLMAVLALILYGIPIICQCEKIIGMLSWRILSDNQILADIFSLYVG